MADDNVRHTAATSLYILPYKQQQMKYIHQTFYNLPPPTLIEAISNGQLRGIPLMKPQLICRYLAPPPATPKGRMKRPRPGIKSTSTKERYSKCEPVKINKIIFHPNAAKTTPILSDDNPDSNILSTNKRACYIPTPRGHYRPCQWTPISILLLHMITTQTKSLPIPSPI